MKRILLCLFILLSLSQARASDTLTVRQVYNFSVGDTFDYKTSNYASNYDQNNCLLDFSDSHYAYQRYIVNSKTLSPSGDSVIYIRHQVYPTNRFDTLIYTNLDSSIFKVFDTVHLSQYLQFDTGSLADGRSTNTLTLNVPLGYNYAVQYGAGVGIVSASYSSSDGISLSFGDNTTLIYYSKGADTMGTAFYNEPDFQTVPHYTPIPEECASWIRAYYPDCIYDLFYEEVKTGNKVFFNGHKYVELYSRYYNVQTAYFQTDSLMGYFRNDTLGQKVYFTNTMASQEQVLYDFTLTFDESFDGLAYPFDNGMKLSRDTIDGLNRVQWSYDEADAPGTYGTHVRHRSYIEGIGGLEGFVLVHDGINPSYAGELISFCICGQSIYHTPDLFSNYNTSSCSDLTGIYTIVNNKVEIHLYPNPTTDQIHLSISEMNGLNYQLILTDILGQEVYSSSVTQSETIHDITNLPQGIYTWRLSGNNNIIKASKLVKQ